MSIPLIGQKGLPQTVNVELAGGEIRLHIGAYQSSSWVSLTPENAAELAHALLKAAAISLPAKPGVPLEPTYVAR